MRTILLLPFLLMAVGASAQLNMPVKAGLNFTQFASDPDSLESSYRLGYNFGVDLRFGETGIFLTGCHFYRIQTQLKSKSQIENEDSFADDVLFNTFNVPANFGFFLYNEDDFKVYIVAGMDIWIPVSVEENSNELEILELQPFFLSGSGMFGLQFWKISLDISYDHAFTQLVQNNEHSKSKTWGASIGFVF
jgi:hypothetical protein